MGQAVFLSLLPPLEKGSPSTLAEQHTAIFPKNKIGFLKYDLSQYEAENEGKEIESAYLSLNYLGKGAGDAKTDRVRVVLSDTEWKELAGKKTHRKTTLPV